MYTSFIKWIEDELHVSAEIQAKILISIFGILAVYGLSYILIAFIKKRTDDVKSLYMSSKTVGYARVFILLLLLGKIWFEGFSDFSTYLGLVSAGIAIALKDLLSNFAGWIFIIWRRPFELGDRIEINRQKGDVIDIRIFQFTIMEIGNWVDADQSTGRIIHIPNGSLFTNPLANYSRGFEFIWNEIGVMITFESNWEKAKTILRKIADEINPGMEKQAIQKIRKSAQKFMIFYKNLTPIVYTTVKDSGVMLTLRYLCEPRKRRGFESKVWENILREFNNNSDIDLAYPTTRFYNNISEGKSYKSDPEKGK